MRSSIRPMICLLVQRGMSFVEICDAGVGGVNDLGIQGCQLELAQEEQLTRAPMNGVMNGEGQCVQFSSAVLGGMQ